MFAALLVPMLSVDRGGDPFIAFEQIDEVAGIHIAKLGGDLGNAFAGFPQLTFCQLNLLAVYIICEALPTSRWNSREK